MLRLVKTELWKLKRYSVIWIGIAAMLSVVLLTRFMGIASDGAVHTLSLIHIWAGVGDVGVNAFLKAELGRAAQVVALPVPGAVGAFAPVFLHVRAVDHDLVRGAFVEAGEVPTQHQEVRAHGQRQGHVVIVDNAAVGADRHVNTGVLIILVPGRGNLDQRGGLTPADALGLPRCV